MKSHQVGIPSDHLFWITEDGKFYGKWSKYKWNFGTGDKSNKFEPTQIKFFSDKGLNVISATSTYEYSAALCDNGRVYTTGYAPKGGIGHGGNPNSCIQWKEVEALRDHQISQVQVGYYFTLFVDEDGNVWSCGENNNGQLGHGR